MKVFLYQIIRLSTWQVYIGITKQKPEQRWKRHQRGWHNPALHRAIRKHGSKAFRFVVVAEFDSWEVASAAERRAISKATQNGIRLYNATAGGEGCLGYRWPEERRRKHTERMKGNKHGLGHKLSPEHAAKLKAAADLVNTPEQMERVRAARWKKS